MTDKEKAIVMAHTGICMLTGDKFQIFHKYVEDIMNRPIMTHELGWLEDEIKEKSKADFMALCANESNSEIPKNSPTETLISLDVYKEVAKERDIAIQQLHELGYEFGQKIEPVIRDNGIKDELNRVKDELEPTTENCESCKYYGSHHEVCNYCYKCSLWTEKEPRKGHWIDTDATHSKCDRCGAIFEIASANGETNFCPNCGADMRGNTKRKGNPIEGNNESYNCENWIP